MKYLAYIINHIILLVIIATLVFVIKHIFKVTKKLLSSPKKFLIIPSASVISSLLIIFINLYRWDLIDLFTVFFEPLLELAIQGIFFATLIFSIRYLILELRTNNYRELKSYRFMVPIFIALLTFLITIQIPFNELSIHNNFEKHYEQREKVVTMIKGGELNSNSSTNNFIQLPPEYEHLSRGGGKVMVRREDGVIKVFFFTFRGILDSFSGFMYSSDNQRPTRNEFNGDFKEFEKFREHWFWGASY